MTCGLRVGPTVAQTENILSQRTTPDWIPFEKGKYQVEQAYLVTIAGRAVQVENPAIHITTGRTGRKHLLGSGRVRNLLVVELLEDSDALDILLDLGGEFTFLLEMPDIQAGKVFSPGVKSTLRFSPISPWKQLTRTEFSKRLADLDLIDSVGGSS